MLRAWWVDVCHGAEGQTPLTYSPAIIPRKNSNFIPFAASVHVIKSNFDLSPKDRAAVSIIVMFWVHKIPTQQTADNRK